MKLLQVLAFWFLFGLPIFAQQVNVTANKLQVQTPSGTCTTGAVRVTTAGVIYACSSGTWAIAGGGSSFTSAVVVTSTANPCLAVGPNGSTNPVLAADCSISSQSTGILITGRASGAGATIGVQGGGTNENLSVIPKGSGIIQLFGTTSSFIAIKKNTSFAQFEFRLADDSGWAPVRTSQYQVYRGSTRVGYFSDTGAATPLRLDSLGHITFGASNDPDSPNIGITESASGVLRVSNGSTGGGNLLLGTSTVGGIGSSGVSVLAVANGTAPGSFPADTNQVFSVDSAAGDSNLTAVNEAGEFAQLTGTTAYVTSQFDKTSNTTLANVTGLTRNVKASTRYNFEAIIYTTSNVAGGIKLAIGGTATATSIVYDAIVTDAGVLQVPTNTRTTTLGNPVGEVTAVTAAKVVITGTILVNAAGTLTVQFAQNVSNGTASSVLVGSNLRIGQT